MQTHEEHDNSMSPHTVGALALRPTGNAQGSFYFMSLSTGRVLNRIRGTALPMPDDVIDQVHWMAQCQKVHPGLVCGDRNMNPTYEEEDEEMSDDEEDEDYIPEGQDDDESQDESQNEINQNSSTGDFFDNEGPTEEDHNESMDDNDEEIQNESASDGYVVAPEMNNTEELGA